MRKSARILERLIAFYTEKRESVEVEKYKVAYDIIIEDLTNELSSNSLQLDDSFSQQELHQEEYQPKKKSISVGSVKNPDRKHRDVESEDGIDDDDDDDSEGNKSDTNVRSIDRDLNGTQEEVAKESKRVYGGIQPRSTRDERAMSHDDDEDVHPKSLTPRTQNTTVQSKTKAHSKPNHLAHHHDDDKMDEETQPISPSSQSDDEDETETRVTDFARTNMFIDTESTSGGGNSGSPLQTHVDSDSEQIMKKEKRKRGPRWCKDCEQLFSGNHYTVSVCRNSSLEATLLGMNVITSKMMMSVEKRRNKKDPSALNDEVSITKNIKQPAPKRKSTGKRTKTPTKIQEVDEPEFEF